MEGVGTMEANGHLDKTTKNGQRYDIFMFNNELDMLEIRLNILSPYVDMFILVEANCTFSGMNKKLNYFENRSRFTQFNDRIIHYVITDTPHDFEDKECDQEILNLAFHSPNVTREDPCWLREFYQKEKIKKIVEKLDPNDICYISDVDEIWNYNLDVDVHGQIYKFRIDRTYIEYLDKRTNEDWTCFTGPIVAKSSVLKPFVLNHVRAQLREDPLFEYISDGGWHFNALGGINKKITDFQHPVYTKRYMRRRSKTFMIDDEGLPKYLLDNRSTYSHLFYEND